MIQTAAQDDIVRQVERYAAQGLPAIARRFAAAAQTAIETAIETPAAGQPHAALAGLHSRPIKGFTDFALFYLIPIGAEPIGAHSNAPEKNHPDRLTVLRVLHIKRDIETIP